MRFDFEADRIRQKEILAAIEVKKGVALLEKREFAQQIQAAFTTLHGRYSDALEEQEQDGAEFDFAVITHKGKKMIERKSLMEYLVNAINEDLQEYTNPERNIYKIIQQLTDLGVIDSAVKFNDNKGHQGYAHLVRHLTEQQSAAIGTALDEAVNELEQRLELTNRK